MSIALDGPTLRILPMGIGDIGLRVKLARESYADGLMRQTDLAKRLDISRQRLHNWESGGSDPEVAMVKEIAKVLQVSARFLLTGEPEKNPEVSGPMYPVGFDLISIPYGGMVPCGEWQDPLDTEDLIELESKFAGKDRFAVKIEGASMMSVLRPDDIAVFQLFGTRARKLHDIVLARREDNAVTVKELQFENGDFVLKSVNPKFDNAQAEHWDAFAFLVGISRSKGTHSKTEYDPNGLTVAALTGD